ncbi:response regulator [Roseateles microcysteis]|uniref:response regulator n=1 Tax=Roseateles microcysteis TaxID=3119057 RepID=UPI002FE581D7
MKPRPRLLLLEDDPTIQHLVRMALEELDLDLLISSTLAEARATLAAAPVQMLISDLMLPDGSGLDLIEELSGRSDLLQGAPIAVFSAGLVGDVQDHLAQLGVWRQLAKPCSILELETCVQEGLGLTQATPSAGANAAAADDAVAATSALPANQAQAVAQHFGGDEPLYRTFRAACLSQFELDREQGDQACEQRDTLALRRLAHSLKSVLLTLGHAAESQLARQLEDSAEQADWPQSLAQWQALRQRLPGNP